MQVSTHRLSTGYAASYAQKHCMLWFNLKKTTFYGSFGLTGLPDIPTIITTASQYLYRVPNRPPIHSNQQKKADYSTRIVPTIQHIGSPTYPTSVAYPVGASFWNPRFHIDASLTGMSESSWIVLLCLLARS